MGSRWFKTRRGDADRERVELPNALDADASAIDLPDLGGDGADEIQPTNIKAKGAIYFSALLEKMRLSQVADKLVELFNAGALPFGRRRRRRDDP